MTRTPLATTASGHKILGMTEQALEGLFEACQKSFRCPDEDLLRKALAAVPSVDANNGVREDFNPALAALYSPEFFLSHSRFSGLNIRVASSDTGERYYFALGDQELFGPRAEDGSAKKDQVAMLFNSIIHHLVASFVKEGASRLAPVGGGDLQLPKWASACMWIRFCPLEHPLTSTPPQAGFDQDNDHNRLLVAYTIANYPQYTSDFMLKHLVDGQWRRTELLSLNGQSNAKCLDFQKALGYVVFLPKGTLKKDSTTLDEEEVRATEQLALRLPKQHELCQEQWMRQFSLRE